EKYGIEAVAAKEPREAVEDMDLVVTAGPILLKPYAAVKPGWLKPGAFASMVDYDSAWDRAALAEIDKFTTDDVPQLEYYRSEGYFQEIPPIYADLGELAAGLKPGRQSATERTVGCNLGLAIDDMATAAIIYHRARHMGLGQWLEA
ncbi:MAG TPA: ornithine cyclodeaminase family protein, partial [Anaerolineae bacterium]